MQATDRNVPITRRFVRGSYNICTYQSHSGTIIDFTEELEGICILPILKNSKLVILAGFFNIDILDSSNPSVSNFTSMLQLNYFIPTVNISTKFPTATSLDHIRMNSTIICQLWCYLL